MNNYTVWLKHNSIKPYIMAVFFVFCWLFMLILLPVTTFAANISTKVQINDTTVVSGVAVAYTVETANGVRVVERTQLDSAPKFAGILTTKTSNLVELNNGGGNVFITTTGDVTALVSDVNGPVKKGDYVTTSKISGVLMKSDVNSPIVVGQALVDYSTEGQEGIVVQDDSGKKYDAHVKSLNISLDVQGQSAINDATSSTALQSIGYAITGRTLSNWQIISSFVIILLLIVLEGSIIYAAVYSSIRALGRNPLAHSAIYRQLFQVILVVISVLLFGVAVIYAIIRL